MFDLSDVYNGDRDNQFYAPITATVINDEFAFLSLDAMLARYCYGLVSLSVTTQKSEFY